MAKIGAYYAARVGADEGTKITTDKSNMDFEKNPAFTIKQTIYLNTNGGFSKSLDNINNFKSVMKHENGHKEDNEKSDFKSNLSNHADVYIDQMSYKSFSSTTNDFKLGTGSAFTNYLLNMDQGNEFAQNEIVQKIETFNETNQGGMYIQPPMGNFAKGTLSLEIQQMVTHIL